jgi:hypothetical protein
MLSSYHHGELQRVEGARRARGYIGRKDGTKRAGEATYQKSGSITPFQQSILKCGKSLKGRVRKCQETKVFCLQGGICGKKKKRKRASSRSEKLIDCD